MNHMIRKTVVLGSWVGMMCFAGFVLAEGNSAAGEEKSAECASCHGEGGHGVVPLFPKLAGLSSAYISKQLIDFKSGQRKDPTMEGLAAALTDDEIANLATYYAEQTIIISPVMTDDDDDEDEEDEDESEAEADSGSEPSLTEDELLALGKKIYLAGNPLTNVPACSACHGPEGRGNQAAGFPVLRYQYADYVTKALTEFKSGVRKNDPNATMRMTVGKMTEQEVEAVSTYITKMP